MPGKDTASSHSVIGTGTSPSDRSHIDTSVPVVTSLYDAVFSRNIELVRSLLNETRDEEDRNTLVVSSQGPAGMTFLHCAAQQGNLQVVDCLINAATDKNSYVVAQDNLLFTALHFAAEENHFVVAERLISETTNRLDYLVEKNCFGCTAIHFAIHSKRLDAVEAFATLSGNSKSYVNRLCNARNTPLQEAAYNNAADIVLFLLKQGADAKQPSTNTAWEIAQNQESWEVIASFILYEIFEGQHYIQMPINKISATINDMMTVHYNLCTIARRLYEETQGFDGIPIEDSEFIRIFAGIQRQVHREFQEIQEAPPHLRSREPSCAVQTLEYLKPTERFVSIVMPEIQIRSWDATCGRDITYQTPELNFCVGGGRKFFERHFPITLDEYCSPALSSEVLELRNKDQVIHRYERVLEERNNISRTFSGENEKGDLGLLTELRILVHAYITRQRSIKKTARVTRPGKTVFVRQSWIWIIGNDAVGSDIPGFYRQIDPGQVAEFVAFHLGTLAQSLDDPMGGKGSLLKIYENALSFISEEVNKYTKSALIDDVDLDQEKDLFHQISDLREELSMIKSVISEQEEVWNEFMTSMQLLDQHSSIGDGSDTASDSSSKSVEESDRLKELWRPRTKFNKYKRRIEKLEQDAERVERNISTQLDLKQKHATMREAHSTAVLSATVFGFTIITVIFAPLSFIAALFALPIDTFNEGKDGNDKDGAYSSNYIGKWSVATEIVSIFVTLLAMWAALRFTGLHVWGKKGLREYIRQKANDVRTAEQRSSRLGARDSEDISAV